ncbi:MAG TPA: glycosyltransferase [Planctomycetota bacterium]|nr:glycosyltransferase [Planctomycetota bacterium]
MRILHLITTLGVGGAEKHLQILTRGQVARGHEVRVAYLKGQGELTRDFEAQGVGVVNLQGGGGVLGRLPKLGELLAARGQLRRLLREWRPDVLHTHLLKADTLGALSARSGGVRALVASKHNDERALLRAPVSLVHGWLSRRVARTICLSDHVARFVEQHGRVPRGRIRRVYYGVDPDVLQPRRTRAAVRAELGLLPDAPVLVCVGRLAPQKDHPTLLAALALLPPDVALLVVGGDPFGDGAERLAARARELGLSDRVRFLGIRHDVPDLLGASDLFVLPSLWEGLGLVFLEAMAVSLPTVATKVSAIPEVVPDGVGGWLVPPGRPDELARAIATALADPAERARRGAAGRALLLQRFTLPRMIDEVLAVYAEARA